MSFLLCGKHDEIRKLGYYLIHFNSLLNEKDLEEWKEENQSSYKITFENKYYVADLLMVLIPNCTDINITNFEGIVLVYSADNIFDVLHIGENANDAEVGLRLLVNFHHKQDKIILPSEKDMMWAIDHGFEYIEIFEDNLYDSNLERDKVGLPRLIEALESHMWSTVRRKEKSCNYQDRFKTPSDCEYRVVDANPELQADCTINNLEGLGVDANPNTVDFNGDENIFEGFEDLMAQAHLLRGQAVSGELSDAQRRENAAIFAMKLSELMNFGDETDDEV